MILSKVQKEIVETPGNMIVSASAGTGKTHTMVAKISKELEENKTHKVIAAITFTVKAAKEIRDRLTVDTSEQFIGTNNSFAIEEIIKPFARDVYGSDYAIDISTDYSKQLYTFRECLQYLKQNKTICSYKDHKKNFVFELAMNIVKQSKACRLFLKSKYFKIYIDEYQDCDKTMHEFFMYLCNDLGINLFVVGDEKQSIYMWRGAYPDAFRSILQMDNFSKKILRENFRSCQQIQNYSNLLNDDTRDLYEMTEDKSSIIYIETSSSKWVDAVLPYLDLTKTCALLRFKNDDAKTGADELSRTGTLFTYIPRTPISEITTNVAWLYNAIAQYFIIKKYSIYDFMDEIPEESIGDNNIKAFLEEKMQRLSDAFQESTDSVVVHEVKAIAIYFGYNVSEDHIKKMIETIKNKEFYPAFQMDELSHIAITFHSSKGLEFDQVILFANDYNLKEESSIYNHYVAATRAKSKLIIVRLTDLNIRNGILYCENISKLMEKSRVKSSDIFTIVR